MWQNINNSEIFYSVPVIINDYTTDSKLKIVSKNGKSEFLFKNCQRELFDNFKKEFES